MDSNNGQFPCPHCGIGVSLIFIPTKESIPSGYIAVSYKREQKPDYQVALREDLKKYPNIPAGIKNALSRQPRAAHPTLAEYSREELAQIRRIGKDSIEYILAAVAQRKRGDS